MIKEIGSCNSYVGYANCKKCGKPVNYVGDVPENGFQVGREPWCTCGTHICTKCGQRVSDKQCDHKEN